MNFSRALLLEREQPALDRADAGGGNVAVVGLELLRVVADVLQHGAQVLEIEQQQPVVVGDLEHQREHAGLRFVQIQDAGEEQRAEVGDGRADRMTLLAEDVPEDGGRSRVRRLVDAEQLEALAELGGRGAGLRDAGEVTLDVGHEHRNADLREPLGHHLQRDRLPGSGRTGDEAVAIGKRRQQNELGLRVLCNQ